MTKRRTTTKSNKAVAPTNEALMTVQLDDLNLGRASNPGKGKAAGKGKKEDSGELFDQVTQLLEQNKSLESSRNVTIEQVDAISQKIEKLTENLGSAGGCECDETADKVNELDARLNSLQNVLKKQSKRGNKIEASLQMIDELGNKIESLSDQIKLAAIESEVTEDYSEQFTLVGDKLTALYQIMEGQAVDPKVAAKQAANVEQKIDVLAKVVSESAKEAQKSSGSNKLIDGLTKKVEAMEKSLHKSIEQNAAAPVEVPDYSSQFDQIAKKLTNGFEKKVDSLGELFLSNLNNNAQPEVDFSKQFEQLASSLNENLDTRIESIQGSIQRSNEMKAEAGDASEQFVQLSEKLEQLQQTVSENQPVENSESVEFSNKLDELTLQVATLQEAIAEKLVSQSGEDNGNSEQLLQKFDSLQESLVERLQSMPVGDSDSESNNLLLEKLDALQEQLSEQPQQNGAEVTDHTQQLNNLSEKVEWISQLMEDRNANGGSSEGGSVDHSEQLRELTERLDSTQSKIDRLVESIGPLVETLARGAAEPSAAADATEVSGIEESAWEKQKRELLAGYGTEPGADSDAICGDSSIENVEGERGEWINEDEDEDEDEGESSEILALKSDLEEKLRRAEIEISIERAKLHREKHQLEQKQQDMEQEMAKLRSVSENEGSESEGRWSRFLGKKEE